MSTAASGAPKRTASQIGRSSLARGKETERAVARAARPWWPGARRSRDNGSQYTPDTGDLAGMSDAVLFWSVKADRSARQDGQMAKWMAEMRAKSGGRIPILIERRDGAADSLRWWSHLWLPDLAIRIMGAAGLADWMDVPVRLRTGDLFGLLELAGLTDQRAPVGAAVDLTLVVDLQPGDLQPGDPEPTIDLDAT